MLPPAVLAAEPDTTMSTTEQKLEKNDEEPANHAPSAPANAGVEEDSLEPVLADAGEGEAPTSGTCGENLTWELNLETGTLTISGTGKMADYSNNNPWYSNDNIKSVIIEDGITSIGNDAFYKCENLTFVSIPGSVTSIGHGAFSYCIGLSGIDIPDSVVSIGGGAFSNCNNLESITIPGNIRTINNNLFYDCDSLVEIIIPDTVLSIGESAFAYCDNLTNISLSDSITSIGSRAFSNCTSLDKIIIPDSVTSIGISAFDNCYNLTSITLPVGVTSIPVFAFRNCNNLTDVYFAGSLSAWLSIEIGEENTCLTNATIHYNSTSPDSITTSVKYLTSWDETSKTAVFSDDSYIRYTASAEAELPANGVGQLVNRYILVECAQDESDVNKGQLFRLQAVNSALGNLTAGTETTVTIDGVEYPWDSQTGSITPGGEPLQVLYHTIDGALAGYTVLSEKMGTAGDWNGTDTVHLDGVDFHTNYMTDQDSLAEISKIADKDQAVVYYFVGDALLKAKLGNNDPVDPPIELYYTKIGTLTACDLDQMTLAIDGKSFSVQDDQYIKDTLKDNLNDAVGKQTVFVITSGKVSYAMPLERVSTRLEAVATVEPSTITYQGGYDRTSIAAKVEVRNVYDVDPWVDTNMLEAAIAQNVPDWNGNITLNHADFEIAWKSSEQSSESIEKFMVFSDGAYEDHFLTNDCKTTVENITVLSLGESATISANIAVNPGYSYNNSEYAADFPKGETEKVVQISAEVEGECTSGETLRDSSVCSITAQYPDNIMTEEEIEAVAAEASEELEKIDGAISLDLSTMYNVFGLKGDAIDQLEKDLLSVIVMSNIPEETLEEKISSDIVDKVIGKYVPKEVTASTYTVPLVYEIATPQSKYGQMTVQFNCDVHTYNLHGTNFALWVTVNYEILRSDKPVRADQVSGFLGQGTRTDVGAFASAAYSLAEAELKKQYNSVWGNSANRVADFLFDDTIKMIFEEMDTTFKDEVWKLIVWPTTNAKIECPVNVFVYDHQDKLVGSIENDVVTKSSDEFELSVDGDTKYITGLEDLYTIKYVATDNGTMDITLTEFSGYETPARQIAFYNVPLIKEKSYTQSVPEAIKSETQEYRLLASDSTVVPADADQSLLNLTPMITPPSDPGTSGGGGSTTGGNSSGGGSSSSGYTVTVEDTDNGSIRVSPTRASRGDTVTITVDPDAGYELDTLIVRNSSGNRIDVERQSDTRYTFEMPSSRVTVEATFVEISEDPTPEPTALPFTDVPASAWYYDAVRFVYERGMMAGTGNNQFSPNVTTTRAMIVTILYRLENQPAAGSANFTDVPAGQWYTSPIAWAAANGIVGGYGDGRFGPNDTITREQMAAILYRYAQFKGYDVSNTGDLSRYADASQVSDWARTAIGWANAQGLITGNTATTLNPTGSATRAEVATILMRFVENVAR